MLGQGYCAATDSPGDCGGSTRTSLATASGYWKASRHKIHSLRDCKRHCFSDCPACVFVSISKRNDDCSWYTTCPTPLQQAYGGQRYATAQVRNRSLGSKRSVLKVTAEDEADSAAVAARFPARPPIRGVCTDTTFNSGRCDVGEQGMWPLDPQEWRALSERKAQWAAATQQCMQRCAACERCRFVSLSLRHKECSWFSECGRAVRR